MAIQLACSTAAYPDQTFKQVAEHAHRLGYRGLDLSTAAGSAGALASDPAATDAGKLRDVLGRCELEPVCLSTSVSLHTRSLQQTREALAQAGRFMVLAGQIGCRRVRVLGGRLSPGQTPRTVLQEMVGHVTELAQRAGDSGVMLLFENGGDLRRSHAWWHLLNEVDHPLVGMAWNVAAAAEAPGVSVPVLSRRLRLARVCDRLGDGQIVPLGEGVVPVRAFVERLLGIGYDGYLVVDWHAADDSAPAPPAVEAEAYLSAARPLIQGWLDEITAGIEKAAVKAAKAAAKNQPKPRAELQVK